MTTISGIHKSFAPKVARLSENEFQYSLRNYKGTIYFESLDLGAVFGMDYARYDLFDTSIICE
ncbi:predicted protein [Botrytis cinerea T4]|uniref:Uncharacterized protein n=1 Tax=Botryotinia fuckeliana (strain T4) TaxID=999810 RepID=G2Y727_BOTF4|nr:predicted protein [Botrytis cinerea T4]